MHSCYSSHDRTHATTHRSRTPRRHYLIHLRHEEGNLALRAPPMADQSLCLIDAPSRGIRIGTRKRLLRSQSTLLRDGLRKPALDNMWTEHAKYSSLPVKEAYERLSAASDFSASKRKLQTTTADTKAFQVSTAASKTYIILETHQDVSKLKRRINP